MSSRTLPAAATLLLLLAPACRKEEPPAPTLTVTPAEKDIAPGSEPFTFTATQTNSSAAVSWSIAAGSCASPGSVDSSTGVYTPPATNDVACTLEVRATAGTLTADAIVNLSALSASGDTLAVTPTSGTVGGGSPTPFTFYVDSSDTVTTPTCALSPDVGTCVEAANPGTHTHAFDVTAPAGLWKTTTAVQATVTVGALSGLVAVTVRPSVLIVSGPTTVWAGGATATYGVTAPDVTGETVVWSLMPRVGSISASGVYTSPTTQQAQTFDVVATIGEARGALSVSLQPLPTGTAAAGLLAMFSALDAKAVECLGWGFGASEMNELSAVAASVQAAVDAGRLTYDAAAQATCLASIEATTCLQMLHYADPGECIVGVFSGRVAQGRQCSESVECVAGYYCGFPTGTCPGSCAPRVRVDGPCLLDDECAAGLVCDNFTCSAVTVVADGATCDQTHVCRATSYCDWGYPSSSCAPLGTAGSTCFDAGQCVASLTCNPLTTTCTQYASRNQACGTTAGCNYFTDYCKGGTCAALPALGQSCADSGRCTWYYWCNTSLAVPTCAEYPTIGQPCAAASQCQWSAYCDRSLATPTCAAYPTAGQPCHLGNCAEEAYCDSSLATPTCVARKTSGSCKYFDECATGYYCDGDYATPGSCRAQGAAGAACSTWDQCQSQLDCIGGICSVTGCY